MKLGKLLANLFLILPLFACDTKPLKSQIPVNKITNTEISKNNTVIVNDQPFFPFGMVYNFLTINNKVDATRQMEALREIAAAGFNTIHAFCNPDADQYSKFLDEAEKLGVFVFVDFHECKHKAVETISNFKDKPAILGWYIADDAGDYLSANEIRNIHTKVKSIDPDNFTYIAISAYSKKWQEYSHVADIIGGASYPIAYPFGNQQLDLSNELSEVFYVFNFGRSQADKHNLPVIANLQSFHWHNKRWPTAQELYNMTYQALLAGVKGIMFYTYDDGNHTGSRIKYNPDLWNQLKSMIPEIKRLSPVLLEGTLTQLETKIDGVIAGQWIHSSGAYVVVVNTYSTDTKEVSITLSPEIKGSARPLFPESPSNMFFEDGKLMGLIAPQDVHVYYFRQENQDI